MADQRGQAGRWILPLVVVFLLTNVVLAAATRIDVPGHSIRIGLLSDDVVRALSPPPRIGDPLYVLMVGSDDRSTSVGLNGRFGRLSGVRADTIMMVRIHEGVVRAVSVPRDTVVDTVAYGPLQLAVVYGLPSGRVDLIHHMRDLSGEPIHHLIEIDFRAFVRFVDGLGGYEYRSPLPVRDLASGFSAPAGGTILTGEQALGLLRSRNLEQAVDGEWVPVGSGDLERVKRGQLIVASLWADVRSNPVGNAGAFAAAARDFHFDRSLRAWGWFRLSIELGVVPDAQFRTVAVVEQRPALNRISPFPPIRLGGALRLAVTEQPGTWWSEVQWASLSG